MPVFYCNLWSYYKQSIAKMRWEAIEMWPETLLASPRPPKTTTPLLVKFMVKKKLMLKFAYAKRLRSRAMEKVTSHVVHNDAILLYILCMRIVHTLRVKFKYAYPVLYTAATCI